MDPRFVTPANPRPKPRTPSRAPTAGAVSVEPVILLTEVKKKPTPPPAEPAPEPEPEEVIVELEEVVDPMPVALETIPPVAPLTLERVIEEIGTAKDTADVADHIVEFLSTKLPAVLLMLVKDGSALGWKGRAPGADQNALESVMYPLSQPSILSEVVDRADIVCRAPANDEPIVARLWKLLHCEAPSEIAVAPIILKDRVVNLVYVHPHEAMKLPQDTTVMLADITRAASDRYLELIVAKKSGE